jgi:hypothetical protein
VEPEALVPRDSTAGVLDIENRYDLLVHEGLGDGDLGLQLFAELRATHELADAW